MKKIKLLFLLYFSVLSLPLIAQVSTGREDQFDNGIKNNAAQTVTNPDYLTTTGLDGTQGKILPGDLPITTSTAVKTGCTIVNNGTTFSVTPGEFEIVNNSTVPPTRQTVVFAGVNSITPLYTRVLIHITPAGTVVQTNGDSGDLSPLQRRENAVLGALTFFGGSVLAVQNTPSLNYGVDSRLGDLLEFLGNMNYGNVVGANGANLQINKGAGRTLRRSSNFSTERRVPDVTEDPAIIPIPAGINAIAYRNGTGGWSYQPYSGSINPQLWDNGTGTPVTVANNKFTNQQVYFFNGTNTFLIYLGQAEYGTLEQAKTAAISAQGVLVDPATSLASLRATISVEKSCTALNNTALAYFTPGPKISGGNSGGGSGGSQNLQSVYLNSSIPQITTTTTLGAVTVRNGTASDTNNTLQSQNIAGTTTFEVKGNGAVTGLTWNNYIPENTSNKDNGALTNSTTTYPTSNAVKTYADGLVVGLLDDRGSYNASSNTFPTTGGSGTSGAVLKGDFWYVGTAGTLGGQTVNVGDSFRALTDAPGQTSSNWSILEGNLGYVPANDANVVHLTGFETLTNASKTFNTSIGAPAITTSTSGPVPGLEAQTNSTTSPAIRITSFSSGGGLDVNSTSSGVGILVNSPTGGSGLNYVGKNNGNNTFTVDKLGAVTGTSFVKSGATSTNILLAGGTDIPQTTFLNGTGTTNYIPKFTGANSLGNSLIYDNGTNVGIGTTSPITKLNVHGGSGDGASFSPRLSLTRTSSTGNVLSGKIALDDADVNFGNIVFKVKTTSSSAESDAFYTDAMTIKGNSGNVLIGTTTDNGGDKLQVNGSGKFNGTSTTSALFALLDSSANATLLQGGSNTSYGWKFIQDELTTGDFFLKRRLADVDINVLSLNRATGAATFASTVTATSFNGSATLTGTPTAPTATAGTNTTQIATTAFVMANAGTSGTYTPATVGIVQYEKCYWTKIGNVVTIVANFTLNAVGGETITFPIPYPLNEATPVSGKPCGSGALNRGAALSFTGLVCLSDTSTQCYVMQTPSLTAGANKGSVTISYISN